MKKGVKIEMTKDYINHPSHYTQGKIEPIDLIHDWRAGFNIGNVIKYIARSGHKGSKKEDLAKARKYIEFELKYNGQEQNINMEIEVNAVIEDWQLKELAPVIQYIQAYIMLSLIHI